MNNVKGAMIERNLFIDLLKIIAIIMVITCHTSDFLTIDAIAVPLFLVITGYNYSASMDKKQFSIKSYYKPINLWNKFRRIIFPFLCLIVAEIIILIIRHKIDIIIFLRLFISGGAGAGSYYTLLIFQIIFLYPFINFLIKKHKLYIFLFFIITFLFEIIINFACPETEVVNEIYRISIFRQVFYLACGGYIYYYKRKIENIVSTLFLIIGFLFYLLLDVGVYKPVIFKLWIGTTLPFGLLAISIVYIFVKCINIPHQFKPIIVFSNATYHIFLTQQIFFWLYNNYYTFEYFSPLMNILICSITGICFYLIQTEIIKLFKNRKQKNQLQTMLIK